MQREKNKEKTNKKFMLANFQFYKKNIALVLTSIVAFFSLAVLSFFDVASRDTFTSFYINEYEVGQVADKNIVADKNYPPTEENPVYVLKGEKILRKGFQITQEEFDKLQKLVQTKSSINYRGYVDCLLFFLFVVLLWIFLFSPAILGRQLKLKELILILVLFLATYGCASFSKKLVFFSDGFNLAILIPSVLSALLVAVLVGSDVAVFFSIIVSIAVWQGCDFNSVPPIFVLCSSFVVTRIVRQLKKRIDFIFVGLLIAFVNVVLSIVLRVMFNAEKVFQVTSILLYAVNGIATGVIALGLLTPLETLMNTASVFRLMDLSDVNTPMMRRLLLAASGTYNHSMMVASLAESACTEIGANSLLARVGAYYHDIGKMEQPEYFTENQQTGENKHNEISPSLSVSVIRRHVKKSVEKLQELHFPKEVIDIVAQHHGNDVISYFYNEAKKTDPNVSKEDYSYMGTPPSTREAAVVMLADTCEAACHSLDKPSASRIATFVHMLVQQKIERGQLDNSPLTFRELSVIEESFVTLLTGYYHTRIKYQNQKDPDDLNGDGKVDEQDEKIAKMRESMKSNSKSSGAEK